MSAVSWVFFVQWLGYTKSFISFVKYAPQAYLNFRRKSTEGWSIGNVLLDFTGGTLSFLQLWVDSYAPHAGPNPCSSTAANIPKLLLSVESVFFDIVFLVQHYILYRKHRTDAAKDPAEIEALLPIAGTSSASDKAITSP